MLKIIERWNGTADLILSALAYPAGTLLKTIRTIGVEKLPRCMRTLHKVGVFPIVNHYYEPLFDTTKLDTDLSEERALPGIDWNIRAQIDMLDSMSFSLELSDVPRGMTERATFYFGNNRFDFGDAEYWYNIIRLKKPRNIIEIGSGFSTLIARRAILKNKEEVPSYSCNHVCIEPFENDWLENADLNVVRERVEKLGIDIFSILDNDDILFIDSSHIIRPQGDVLFEYLSILPSLRAGVIVHIHDIFSPRDYPSEWILSQKKFWNEQYLLEAFLTENSNWEIIGALNFLQHNFHSKLKRSCPTLVQASEPGSFYIQRKNDN